MRVLFLSNFYPPYEPGGQGLSCLQVVEGFKQRGHSTLVLTSSHKTDDKPLVENGVIRKLHLEMDLVPLKNSITFFTRRKARERQNLILLETTIVEFQPDIIFIWGMWNLHRSLAALAEAQCPNNVVYRFAEYWPTLPNQQEIYWKTPGRNALSRLVKMPLAPFALRILQKEKHSITLAFRNTICVSAATRDTLLKSGIPVENCRIINTGFEYPYPMQRNKHRASKEENSLLNLIYAGRLTPEKGIETAIDAIAILAQRQGIRNLHLTIAGSGNDDYEKQLKDIVERWQLSGMVSFLGKVPYDEMAALYQKMDVLILPSIWPEPLARVILEAWFFGLVVVASDSGGNKELIQDGENGLLFPTSDSQALANLIAGLQQDPRRREALKKIGQETILEKHSFAHMMDLLEDYFFDILQMPKTRNVSQQPVGENRANASFDLEEFEYE